MRMGHTARRLAVLGAIAVVAAPWAMVAHTLGQTGALRPPEIPVRATSVVWGGLVFTSPDDLAGWLRSHGGSYEAWAAQHPYDRAILEGTTTSVAVPTIGTDAAAASAAVTDTGATGPETTTAAAAAASPTTTPAETVRVVGASESPPSATAPSGHSVSWVTLALLGIATMAMLAALVPPALVEQVGEARLGTTQRAYLFAAGCSVWVGVLVAGALS